MKTILALLLLIPSLSWGNLSLDNLYKENEYELNSIAHCKGFLQGIVDIFDYLVNEHSKEVTVDLSEEEIKEFSAFQLELNNFNNITANELDFQLGMKCGKDNSCRLEYANKVVEGFEKGFNIVYTLNDTVDGWFSKEAEQYLDQSDVLLEMCFNKADG